MARATFANPSSAVRVHILPPSGGFRSVVVITFASHAKGPRFETGRKHNSWRSEGECQNRTHVMQIENATMCSTGNTLTSPGASC